MVKIMVKYVSEIPNENFDKWLKAYKIGKRAGIMELRELAIDASEKEINYIVNESWKY